jgi:hypothetical protein
VVNPPDEVRHLLDTATRQLPAFNAALLAVLNGDSRAHSQAHR